ncbi:MAG: flavodoxin domain-containing protein [Eubacteriales bacterium]|jgi:flavodoxin|nr:flavodoxin domain-containing protein [Eubacteriales bacterium]
MNIGIIVYSKTGNTLQVAERIKVALELQGNTVSVKRFQAETSGETSNTPLQLTASPDPNVYDAVIFGAPVQAFSLDPAMAMYLRQIGTIRSMPAMCFITQHFKKPWMGGNRAMKQLLMLLKSRSVTAVPMGVVNWSSEQRDAQIEFISRKCAEALKENRA